MRARDPRIWLAALSVLFVALLVFLDLESTSPGALSMTHARVAELDERDCAACHGDGETTLADACNACHETIGEQLAGATGFHGGLESAAQCGRCHTEHFGAEVPLVGERAFVLAGFASRADFDHPGLDFALHGKHDELDCAACHANADELALAVGERRFLGASQDCASCHEDPHEGRMVKSCEACHGQSLPFTDLDGFRHTDDFPLVGAHANSRCVDCHEPGGRYAVEALGGASAPPARDCAACHESPHSDPFVQSVADLVELTAGASCESCHPVEGAAFREADRDATERLHAASGFPLVRPHVALDCASCHDLGDLIPPDAPRSPDDCASCHDSPHGAQFETGPFADADCLVCHAREHFAPSILDADLHARTGFALTDAHARSTCAECHEPEVGATLAEVEFGAVDSTCAACHADAHGGAFDAASFGTRTTSDCAECHRPTRFDDLPTEEFDHRAWTGFALEGSHSRASCEACHERAHEPDRFGRRFGRVAELFGTPVDDCATCHQNVHVGAMAGSDLSCANCHEATRFDDVDRAAFDHATEAAFALRGAHADAGCELCHAPRVTPDEHGRTFGTAVGTFGSAIETCASCHEDPHGGRFDRPESPRTLDGRASCARCHDETSFASMATERFDHATWTGYALTGSHARASCADCHGDATGPERYAATPTACASCHDDPHVGQFGRGTANRCERCHTTAGGFDDLVFDHQRDARFALDENHRPLDCAACHKPWPLASGGEAVRYKPLGIECADCHLGSVPR